MVETAYTKKQIDPPVATRIAIVDQALMAESLSIAFSTQAGFDVEWAVESPPDGYHRLQNNQPQLLLIDTEIGQGAWRFVQTARKTAPDTRIVVLTMNRCDAFLQKALEMQVAGYILKTSSLKTIAEAIRRIASGEVFFSDELKHRINGASAANECHTDKQRISTRLTTRQMEVMTLLGEGATAKDIARNLQLSVKGVNSHTYRIMRKLEAHNRVELARIAIREGLVAP